MPILSVANFVAMSSHSVYRRLLCLVMTAALLALGHPPSQQPPGTSTSLGPPFLCHDTLARRLLSSRQWVNGSSKGVGIELGVHLGDGWWIGLPVWWFGEHMGKSAFQTGLKLHPLVSPTILSANMWDMFHFFLVFQQQQEHSLSVPSKFTKDFYGLYHDAL